MSRRNDNSVHQPRLFSSPAHLYNNLSLNSSITGSSSNPLNRRTSLGGIDDSKNPQREHPHGNYRPQRYRPAFAVGVTLKEFSVQSTVAPKKKQQYNYPKKKQHTEEENERGTAVCPW